MHTPLGLTLFIKRNGPAIDDKLRQLQGDFLPPFHHLPLSELLTHTRPCSPQPEEETPASLGQSPWQVCQALPCPWDSEQAPSIFGLTPKSSFLFSAPEDTPVLQDSQRVGPSPPYMPQ